MMLIRRISGSAPVLLKRIVDLRVWEEGLKFVANKTAPFKITMRLFKIKLLKLLFLNERSQFKNAAILSYFLILEMSYKGFRHVLHVLKIFQNISSSKCQ